MSDIESFPPVVGESPRLLILGSMPGVESLRQNRYYAHPRNAFWRLMSDLFGLKTDGDYDERLSALKKGGIALWDVLHRCKRDGSLDTDITDETANDFEAFFKSHPSIKKVVFNGAKAENSFRMHVEPRLSGLELSYKRLPSTSPAHAGMPYEKKLELWRDALG